MKFYRRKLPHWQPKGAQYFITFRLANSLPRSVIEEIKKFRNQFQRTNDTVDLSSQLIYQRKVFQKYELALDIGNTGPTWLNNPAVAKVVKEALHYRDTNEYDLFAYCLMSNHLHIVFEHLDKKRDKIHPELLKEDFPITGLLHELKRYTALESNKILHRKGSFWQSESYDRVIRNAKELEHTIAYTLNNPVKAGLVKYWRDWPHTYCKLEFMESFE